MPREQNKPEPSGGASPLDVFSAAEGAKPPLPQSLRTAPEAQEEAPLKAKRAPTARKPAKAKPAEKPQPRRVGRKKTGRNVAFNQTVSLDTANMFYDLHGELGITMGEILERAAIALTEKVAKQSRGNSA